MDQPRRRILRVKEERRKKRGKEKKGTLEPWGLCGILVRVFRFVNVAEGSSLVSPRKSCERFKEGRGGT